VRFGALSDCRDGFGRIRLERAFDVSRQAAGVEEQQVRRHAKRLREYRYLILGGLPLSVLDQAQQGLGDPERFRDVSLREAERLPAASESGVMRLLGQGREDSIRETSAMIRLTKSVNLFF
jgi:hypothetical protein